MKRWFVLIFLAAVAVGAGCSSSAIEKEAPAIVVVDDMGSPNSSVDCGEGRAYCDGTCIDTSLDSENCGDCGVECPESTVCSESACVPVPADCRSGEACPTSYYCDQTTGFCALGCDTNEDCPSASFCQIEVNTCLCQAEGEVVCGSQCVSEGPTACGADCQTCPTQANATAVCVEGECEIACDDGTSLCDGTCAVCPSGPGVAGTTCAGATCIAAQCEDGFELCNGVCAACPGAEPGASFGCDDTQCVVTDCPTGTRLCDGACAECPDPTGGRLQCVGSQCTLACNAGSHLCSDVCVADDDVSNCGPNCLTCPGDPNGDAVCEQGACGVVCDTDFRECNGACAACPTVGVASTRCAGNVCAVATCEANFYPCALGCCQDPTSGLVTTSSNTSPSSLDLALDGNGFPMGVYAVNGDAGFFSWDGQQWAIEALPGATFAAMDLDANGVPHVALSSSTDLLYGKRTNGAFTMGSFTRVSGLDPASAPDIAIDAAGNAHIVYETQNLLRHRTSADGWTSGVQIDPDDVGPKPSLQWNGTRLHVIYSEGRPSYDDLLFYRWYDSASGWSSRETINSGLATASQTTSLAFTPSGEAWAVWSGVKASAARGPGTWTNLGEASPSTAIDPKVVIDNAGVPHIFYTYYGIQQISWTGAQWSGETEIAPDHELPTAIFDSNGVLHLFYFDGADLKYLRL